MIDGVQNIGAEMYGTCVSTEFYCLD